MILYVLVSIICWLTFTTSTATLQCVCVRVCVCVYVHVCVCKVRFEQYSETIINIEQVYSLLVDLHQLH